MAEAQDIARSTVNQLVGAVTKAGQKYSSGNEDVKVEQHLVPEAFGSWPVPQRLCSSLLVNTAGPQLLQRVRIGAADVLHVAVHAQGPWLGTACGHFALHHALSVVQILTDLKQSDWPFTDRFLSAAAFSFALHRQVSCLRRQQAQSGIFSQKNIDSLELFRAHMQHLIAEFPMCQEYGARMCFSSVPSISRREMESGVMTSREVLALERLFQRVRMAKNTVHALLIGSGDHWLSVVVNKYQDTTELIVLDSCNVDFMGKDEDALLLLAKQKVDEETPFLVNELRHTAAYKQCSDAEMARIVLEGRPWPHRVPAEQERMLQLMESWQDLQTTISMICQCLDGTMSLASMYVDTLACAFRRSLPDTDLLTPQQRADVLIEWMRRFITTKGGNCHPVYLRDVVLARMRELGHEAIRPHTREIIRRCIAVAEEALVHAGLLCRLKTTEFKELSEFVECKQSMDNASAGSMQPQRTHQQLSAAGNLIPSKLEHDATIAYFMDRASARTIDQLIHTLREMSTYAFLSETHVSAPPRKFQL